MGGEDGGESLLGSLRIAFLAGAERASVFSGCLAHESGGRALRFAEYLGVSFIDGHSEVLEGVDEGWSGWGYDMYRVTPLADGTRLDGSISSAYYSGFSPGSGVSGGVSSASQTIFHPDGRYSGSSFGGAFGNFNGGGGYAVSNSDDEGGSYEIRDGLVVFSPANGGGRRAAMAFRSGDDIVIGDQFLAGTAR